MKQESAGQLNFGTVTKENAKAFAEVSARILTGMFGVQVKSVSEAAISKANALDQVYFASILFIGTVFGEFIFSLSEPTAQALYPGYSEEQISEALSETLNIVVGQCLGNLGKYCHKLTITAPRTGKGRISLPHVRAARSVVSTGAGDISCLFYIDQMKLDLATSYKEVISKLTDANEDLKEANLCLRRQQAQLVQTEKMASIGVMAAGVAHEINNPLAFVSGNIEVLEKYVHAMGSLLKAHEQLATLVMQARESDGLQSKVAEVNKLRESEDVDFILSDTAGLISQSQDGLSRIKKIVSALRRFSRTDADAPTTLQVNEEVENALVLVSNQLKGRCRIEKNLKAVGMIEGFAGQLSQVIVNLLTNAMQAMPSSGGIIKISTEQDGTWLVIKVSDSGSGISPEYLGRIFTPFFTTKPVGEGTGLGLAISYGIIQHHGGTIDVESQLGKGTTFTIRLPASQEKQNVA